MFTYGSLRRDILFRISNGRNPTCFWHIYLGYHINFFWLLLNREISLIVHLFLLDLYFDFLLFFRLIYIYIFYIYIVYIYIEYHFIYYILYYIIYFSFYIYIYNLIKYQIIYFGYWYIYKYKEGMLRIIQIEAIWCLTRAYIIWPIDRNTPPLSYIPYIILDRYHIHGIRFTFRMPWWWNGRHARLKISC